MNTPLMRAVLASQDRRPPPVIATFPPNITRREAERRMGLVRGWPLPQRWDGTDQAHPIPEHPTRYDDPFHWRPRYRWHQRHPEAA